MSDVRVDDVVAGLPVRSFSTNTRAAAAASAAEGVKARPDAHRIPLAVGRRKSGY